MSIVVSPFNDEIGGGPAAAAADVNKVQTQSESTTGNNFDNDVADRKLLPSLSLSPTAMGNGQKGCIYTEEETPIKKPSQNCSCCFTPGKRRV